MRSSFMNEAIGRIYDCTVDQSHWVETLNFIRNELDVAFVSVQFIAFPEGYPEKPPETILFCTEWDNSWFDALQPLIAHIPKMDEMFAADIDVPVSQMRMIDEEEFQKSRFYDEWVEPQGLRDTLNANIILRGNVKSLISAPSYKNRALFSDEDFDIIRQLTPHIRRSLLISDLLDEQNAKINILQRTLDQLPIGVFLVEPDGRIAYNNSSGEGLLSDGSSLTAVSNKLHVQSSIHRSGFMTAVARACTRSDLDIQNWGNGIPIPGSKGETAVAYILPLGRSERRNALGPGMAAVFITTDRNSTPPSIEVISAVTGLTTAEANVAIEIATGSTPEEVAEKLGVTIHTVRKHLANAFDKTGQRNQTGLSGVVNRLSLPSV